MYLEVCSENKQYTQEFLADKHFLLIGSINECAVNP